MFYNHKRKLVQEWAQDRTEESLCPGCNAPLVSRQGDLVRWHWAHHPKAHERSSCPFEESLWHLALKEAYMSFGFEGEKPLMIGDKTFRIDAYKQGDGVVKIREFVHSLSPHYVAKHQTLQQANEGVHYDILWILDGNKFVSARRRPVSEGKGFRRFLIPRAYAFHKQVRCFVHYDGQLWHEWDHNVWYPNDGELSQRVADRHAEIFQTLRLKRTSA